MNWLLTLISSMNYCSIPFSVDEISKSMEQVELADVDPPPLLRENSGFAFLLQRSDWSKYSIITPVAALIRCAGYIHLYIVAVSKYISVHSHLGVYLFCLGWVFYLFFFLHSFFCSFIFFLRRDVFVLMDNVCIKHAQNNGFLAA